MKQDVSEFLSNVVREDANIILQAAHETGFDEIYILDNAKDKYGKPVSDCVAVYSPYTIDHEPFWNKYRELKNEK